MPQNNEDATISIDNDTWLTKSLSTFVPAAIVICDVMYFVHFFTKMLMCILLI
jgi:hypothetical protein